MLWQRASSVVFCTLALIAMPAVGTDAPTPLEGGVRYPAAPAPGSELSAQDIGDAVYYHALGTAAAGFAGRGEDRAAFNPQQFETPQVFYPDKDGTRIPMMLAYRKGLRLDGSNPLLLYGHGGFGIPLLPTFNPALIAWLELGGVYAIANIRGGGEYGEAWHRQANRTHKQVVFDDFIAAIAAIAAIAGVGVMDMLRFDRFGQGAAQTGSEPVLLYIERSSGHGGGPTVSQAIEQNADIYAFLADRLRLQSAAVQ